jgi:excisionase family DNA binding protein
MHYRKKKNVVVSVAQSQPTAPIAARGLRVAEVAAYTGATVCMVRAAISKKELPALTLGKRHVILREDADAWLSSLRVKS